MAPQAGHGYKCSLFATREAVGGRDGPVAKGHCLLLYSPGTQTVGHFPSIRALEGASGMHHSASWP